MTFSLLKPWMKLMILNILKEGHILLCQCAFTVMKFNKICYMYIKQETSQL